jgi:hypothetical protein
MRELLDNMKNSLPKYNIVQPSTGKLVTFRPFTVREEKALVIANQTGSYEDFLSTLSDIIDNCFNLTVSAKKLPIFDVEFFFLKLRSKSVGEIIEPTITCPATQEKIKILVNLDAVEPITTPSHSKEILIASNILVKMNYPSLENLIKRSNVKTDYFDLLLECIQSIETNTQIIETGTASIEEMKEFIELLTSEQYKKLIDFFKTCPRLEQNISYTTSDGTTREIVLKGLRDFFQ